MDRLPVGISICDIDGTLVQYNMRAAALWGDAPALGAAENRFCGAHKVYHLDGEPLADDESPMARLLETGEPQHDREMIIERADGSRLTILANMDPLFDDDGNLVGGVSCFQDITGRKQAEAKLAAQEQWCRDLIDALPAAVYTTDAEGRLTFFNEAAADLAGRRPEIGIDSWSVSLKLYSPSGAPMSDDECPMAVALKTGEPVRDREIIVERPDGTRRNILPFPTPLRDGLGRVIGAVNMLVDITDRKHAEQEKTVLLRELAHRVNNTFAVIFAITQQSLRTATSPQAFAESFTGRLQALARAHNLLLARDWGGASLSELASTQLAVSCPEMMERVKIDGPVVMLAPSEVVGLGALLHELGANACKYGALSTDGGLVDLSWKIRPNGSGEFIDINWVESGGPTVFPPSQRGLGSRLIERGLANAKVDWCFEPEGLICTIALKHERRGDAREDEAENEAQRAPTVTSGSRLGH